MSKFFSLVLLVTGFYTSLALADQQVLSLDSIVALSTHKRVSAHTKCINTCKNSCKNKLEVQVRKLRRQGRIKKSVLLSKSISKTCNASCDTKCASKAPQTLPEIIAPQVPEPTATATSTSTPIPTPTHSHTPTHTPTRTPTSSAKPQATATPRSTATLIPTAVPQPIATRMPTATNTAIPTNTPVRTATPTGSPLSVQSSLSAVWANDGGDKVVQSDLRMSSGHAVTNSVWDGTSIKLFGAKDEVVSFNLVLEASLGTVDALNVSFNALNGPNGYSISSRPVSGLDDIFNYVGRNIELFHMQYLEIKGLSKLSYQTYDERHIPARMRRPFTGAGYGSGTWANRPDANKSVPDIAVPLEAKGAFSVAAGNNQSIWADIYIPKDAPSGNYTGMVNIKESGVVTRQVPVRLEVMNFTLPDAPSAKTMVYLGYSDINKRYLGQTFPSAGTLGDKSDLIRDRHFQMAHRHKISLIDTNDGHDAWSADAPRPQWLPRLNGNLFTSQNGYDGPGAGVGNGIFSIGTYGTWGWKGQNEAAMRTRTDNWVNWFNANSPSSDYFLYLIDESTDYAQTEQWAEWLHNNPGVGHNMKSFATTAFPLATSFMPSLDIAASWFGVADKNSYETAVHTLNAQPGKHAFMYNGVRPASGSFATEDDGVALRELPWGQHKKKIDRWFFWESTYYNNYQAGAGETNVFKSAQTFGGSGTVDPVLGNTGWNYSNGDGLLFYPGTDTVYPAESYGLNGPLASVRLKDWRRGIQDVDYVTLAESINPTATAAIVNAMVPKALWENDVTDHTDPTWVRSDISWSTDPDDWESARKALANIILGAS